MRFAIDAEYLTESGNEIHSVVLDKRNATAAVKGELAWKVEGETPIFRSIFQGEAEEVVGLANIAINEENFVPHNRSPTKSLVQFFLPEHRRLIVAPLEIQAGFRGNPQSIRPLKVRPVVSGCRKRKER
jgi:hypothetical protein